MSETPREPDQTALEVLAERIAEYHICLLPLEDQLLEAMAELTEEKRDPQPE